jgi:hypothetical protein
MSNARPSLILTLFGLVVLLGAYSGSDSLAADGWDDSGLQDRFSKIRAGMDSSEVEEILGPADEVIPDETDASHEIFVWRERWFGFTRATVVIKIKNDRVAIAIHSAGNIRNPAAYVKETEQRSHRPTVRSRYLGDPVIPGALLSDTKPWADLSSILDKLNGARRSRSMIEPDTVALFDSITPENDLESVLVQGRSPRTSVTEGTNVTYTWDLGTARVTATFDRGGLTSKRLDSPELEVIVRKNYWKARDLRSGLTVTEYL